MDMKFKCNNCARLLPSAHFSRPVNVLKMRLSKNMCKLCLFQTKCKDCGRHIVANQRASTQNAEERTVCEKCVIRREHAKVNVYFRYPQTKFRWAPCDKIQLREELLSQDPSRIP